MSRYQNFYAAQDEHFSSITYRRFKKNTGDIVIRAEGVTLETDTDSSAYNNRGNDVSHMVGREYDWRLFPKEDSDNDGGIIGSIVAIDRSDTKLKFFFEPSRSSFEDFGKQLVGSNYYYKKGWPFADDITGSDNWVLASERMRVAELVIDLRDAPSGDYKYAVMANVDLSCDYGMHPHFAECQILKGMSEKASHESKTQDSQSDYGYNQSPDSYGRCVYYAPVKNRQNHWQAVFPVTLKSGELYRIPIIVGTYIKYYSWRGGTTASAGISRGSGAVGGNNNSGNGWDFPPLEGATITAANAKIHAFRIDNATYAEASNGKEPAPASSDTASGYEAGGSGDKATFTNLAKSESGIVRKLEVDNSAMKGGDYLVLFSAVLSNNSEQNFSSDPAPLDTKVYFGKVNEWSSSYYSDESFIKNASIRWPGSSGTPYSGWNQDTNSFSMLDQVSIGYAGISHFRSEDHADWSGSTLKQSLIFALGGDALKPTVKSYYICAVKLSDIGESVDSEGNNSQLSFEKYNSLSPPQVGLMTSSVAVESQKSNYFQIDAHVGGEDSYSYNQTGIVQSSTSSRANTSFYMAYTPDSLLDAVSGGSRPDNGELVARWEDVTGNSRHLDQTDSSYQAPSKHNAINGYQCLDLKRPLGDTSWGGDYSLSSDLTLNSDTTNYTNCLWWVVSLRRATNSSGGLYHNLDNDSQSQQSTDETYVLAKTISGTKESGADYSNAGSNNYSEWSIRRTLGSSDDLIEELVLYTDGKEHSLKYSHGMREAWADQEWRVICCRRISKTQVEVYINGILIGVTDKFVHTSNGNDSGDYPDRIGSIGAQYSGEGGEYEIAEFAVVNGLTTAEEVAYHNERLIDKYGLNQLGDQKGYTNQQKYAEVSWNDNITSSENRFLSDEYPETGNYLEIVSHGGFELEAPSDDTVTVTGASGSPTVNFLEKEYGIFCADPSGISALLIASSTDWRYQGSNLGGHGKWSTSKNSLDGSIDCRDYGYIHIFAIRDSEFQENGLGMTVDEYNAIQVGDIFEIYDDTNGFQELEYDTADGANFSTSDTYKKSRVEVEIIEKVSKGSTLYGEDGNAVTLPNDDGDPGSPSILFPVFFSSNRVSVFTFRVARKYSDRDTLPFRVPRSIGQDIITYNASSTTYTTDFAAGGSTSRFRKIRSSNRSAEVRPKFGDSESNYHNRYPSYARIDDTQYSFIYKSTGFRTSTSHTSSDAAPTSNGVSILKWLDSSGRSGSVTLEDSGDPNGDYHLEQDTSSDAPTTTFGPTGENASAIHFTTSSNTSSGQFLSIQAGDNGQDADLDLTDQAMVCWVISFDKKSGTWRHPLAGTSLSSGSSKIIYFESHDELGNGVLVFRNSGSYGAAGSSHEVRCNVQIPPDSWHTITFLQQDKGSLSGKDGRDVRFFVDGYEKVRSTATEGQSGSNSSLQFEHIGKVNGWFLSAKIADIRARAARSTASPAISSAGTYQEQQAVEYDLANTYKIETHRLRTLKQTATLDLPNSPSGIELIVHLQPKVESFKLFRSTGSLDLISDLGSANFSAATPVLSSDIEDCVVAQWDNSAVSSGANPFEQGTHSLRPSFAVNVCNGYPGVKFSSGYYLVANSNSSDSTTDLIGGSGHNAGLVSGLNIFAVVKLSKTYNTGAIATCQGINIGLSNYSNYSDHESNSSYGIMTSSEEEGMGSSVVVSHSETDETTMSSYQYNQTPESKTDNMNSDFSSGALKWPPFNGIASLDEDPAVVSLSYNSAGEPVVRINGSIVMDYTGDLSGRTKYTSTFTSTVSMLKHWCLGANPNSTGLVSFDGYLMEFVAYRASASGMSMTDAEHMNVVGHLCAKYNIHTANTGPYVRQDEPLGRGRSGEMTDGSMPGFWINNGTRYAGDKVGQFIEARLPFESISSGFKSLRVYEPSFSWLKYNNPRSKVREDTPVTLLVDSEKSLVLKRGWTLQTGSPSYYYRYLDEEQPVVGVIINGSRATRYRDKTWDSYSLSWHWDNASKIISVVLDWAGADPNSDDYTVSIILGGHYSRYNEDICELPMPLMSSSTARSPSTSDNSIINKSIYPDIATEGRIHTPYEPRLMQIPSLGQEFQSSRDSLSVSSSYGQITLAGADGEFDKAIAQNLFEGLNSYVYKGYSSLDNRKESFEFLFKAKQGMPSLRKENFSMGLFDESIGFNDALDSNVYEANSDDISNGIVKYSARSFPIYFGKNERVEATRVSHSQVDKSSSSPNQVSQTVYFKVCNHDIKVLDYLNASGAVICKAIFENQTDEVPFQVRAQEEDSLILTSVVDSLIITNDKLTKAGLIGIRAKNNYIYTGRPAQHAYMRIMNASAIYLNIEGVSQPNRWNPDLAGVSSLRTKIDTPGECYRYLIENYPLNRDEKNGFYSTTLQSDYTPQITEGASGTALTLHPDTDMSKFDSNYGTRVLLRQVINSDTGETRYFHAIVIDKDSSQKKIWIQPQFVSADVRLDAQSGDNFTNVALSTEKFSASSATLLVYEKFIGLPEENINYNSIREIDKKYRLKQDTNASGTRVVRFPVPTQVGFAIESTGALSNALESVGRQFFSYYYIDHSGKFHVDVPDFKRQNLLENPGFEKNNLIAARYDNEDDTTSTLRSLGTATILRSTSPWRIFNLAGASTDDISSNAFFTGNQSLILKAGISQGYIEQAVPLGLGKYVFSAMVAAGEAGAPSDIALSVVLPDGDTPEVFSPLQSIDGSKWQRISMPFVVGDVGSGTCYVRIYADGRRARTSDEPLSIRVDDCELYKVAAFADENNSDYFPLDFEIENFYESLVYVNKSALLPTGSAYRIVNDARSKAAGLAASESRASLESSGRLNFEEANAREIHDALEIAAKGTAFYSRMRAKMTFSLMDFDAIPKIGDIIYFDPSGRNIETVDSYPFWVISSVNYDLQKSANEITVEAMRQLDPVADRDEIAVVNIPTGAIVLCTGSSCPTGFEEVSGLERKFIGAPEEGETPESVDKGSYVHTHTATHNHTINDHTHTEIVSQYTGTAYDNYLGDAFQGISYAQISSGAGTTNKIRGSSHSHNHSNSSESVTTGSPTSTVVSNNSQSLPKSVNFASYISVKFCKRVAVSFELVNSPGTDTDLIPPSVTLGWESQVVPDNYQLNSDFNSSEPLLIQAEGSNTNAISGISITAVYAGIFDVSTPTEEDEAFVINVDSQYAEQFEANRVITASSGANEIQLLIQFSANGLLIVRKMQAVKFDTSYSHANTVFDAAGFPAAGWTLSSPSDPAGTIRGNLGHHSHGSNKAGTANILDSHTHSVSHRHPGGTATTNLGATATNQTTEFNSGKDINLGKDQNSHGSFGDVGNMPILFLGSEFDKHTNQMATAADYLTLTNQHTASGVSHNNVDWDGDGQKEITEWTTQPNTGDYSISPYNHEHDFMPAGGPQVSKTSSSARGVGNTDSGANQMKPPAYLLNWIQPEPDEDGESQTQEVPTGAIIFIDGDLCPTGYVPLSNASNLLIGVQSSGPIPAASSLESHAHSITASAHSATTHNHGTFYGSTGRAYLPTGTDPKYRLADNSADWDGEYDFFSSFSALDGCGSSDASHAISGATRIYSPVLFPVDATATILSGDPTGSSFPSGSTSFSPSTVPFAKFVERSRISGDNYNVAQDSGASHLHWQRSEISDASLLLQETAFSSNSKSGNDLKPIYRELLACKKL